MKRNTSITLMPSEEYPLFCVRTFLSNESFCSGLRWLISLCGCGVAPLYVGSHEYQTAYAFPLSYAEGNIFLSEFHPELRKLYLLPRSPLHSLFFRSSKLFDTMKGRLIAVYHDSITTVSITTVSCRYTKSQTRG